MKHLFLILTTALIAFGNTSYAQVIQDLFRKSETKVYWLGVDYSQVKLIGEFNQFAEWGEISLLEIRNNYFPAWNDMVFRESEKYDVAAMVRKEEVHFQTEIVTNINKETPIEEMEASQEPAYTVEDLQSFVNRYTFDKEGLGMVLIAESLNKFKAKARYHFLVINMSTKEILLHKEINADAGGFGMRNYWAKTLFNSIKQIKERDYFEWKKEYIVK